MNGPANKAAPASGRLPTPSVAASASSGSGQSGQSGARRAELSRVAWLHPGQLDFHQWAAAGRRFGEIGRGSQWWIGDWLLYGTSRFGERYVEASKITGYDPKSLRNMRYVASQFAPSLRRDNLNWSHHALLAGLEPADRTYWLDRASADRLSVEDLRSELRSARRGNYAESDADAVPSLDPDQAAQLEASGSLSLAAGMQADALVCPNCGSRVPMGSTGARALGEAL
jgi:hypothetical protein